MLDETWVVILTPQTRKAPRHLSKNALASLGLLLEELKSKGPHRYGWPNFGKLGSHDYYCHIHKGRPTYVACWRVDKTNKVIEVYYAGTHENVPY